MSKLRKVTVFSTVGSKRRLVETNAETWKELKTDLDKADIAYNDMRAIVGENQVTLESDGATLPLGLTVGDKITNNFTLFLSPKRVKSGSSTNTSALLKRVKQIIETLEQRLKNNTSNKRPIKKSSFQEEVTILAKRAKEIERSIIE